MITKAYIINKEQNSNKYYVRIPIFEKPGINSENSNLSRTHFSATLAHEPTIFDAYNIGDCVFVGFENNELNRPVIIGKLYTKNDTSATSGLIETKVLKVLDKVTLPADTTIGGINFSNISNFFNSINDTLNKKDIFVDSIQFKTNNEGAGLVNFNDKEGLAQITLSPNVTMAIGVDEVLKVYNDTDETLVDGTVVYRTGVKKETNAILEDYQLVVNGDLLIDSNSDNIPDGFSLNNATPSSLINSVFSFVVNQQYGNFRFINTDLSNINDTYYIYSSFKSSSSNVRLLTTNPNNFSYHSGSNTYEYHSYLTKKESINNAIYIEDTRITDFTPIEVDYIGAFNVSQMRLKGVKDDNGVLFSDLTNEDIKTQLDKWMQRGVSGTTKVQPAIANDYMISNNTIGVVTETIASNDYGFISRHGFVGGVLLDPNIYTVGETLYLSPDVEGAFTNQMPVAPNFVTQIGYVNMVSSDSHTADGQIYVDIKTISVVSPIAPPIASEIITDVSQFNGILSSDDTNVQLALNTLDNHTHSISQLGAVPDTRKIADINLKEDITATELTAKLDEVTPTTKGLMSPADKNALDTITGGDFVRIAISPEDSPPDQTKIDIWFSI